MLSKKAYLLLIVAVLLFLAQSQKGTLPTDTTTKVACCCSTVQDKGATLKVSSYQDAWRLTVSMMASASTPLKFMQSFAGLPRWYSRNPLKNFKRMYNIRTQLDKILGLDPTSYNFDYNTAFCVKTMTASDKPLDYYQIIRSGDKLPYGQWYTMYGPTIVLPYNDQHSPTIQKPYANETKIHIEVLKNAFLKISRTQGLTEETDLVIYDDDVYKEYLQLLDFSTYTEEQLAEIILEALTVIKCQRGYKAWVRRQFSIVNPDGSKPGVDYFAGFLIPEEFYEELFVRWVTVFLDAMYGSNGLDKLICDDNYTSGCNSTC